MPYNRSCTLNYLVPSFHCNCALSSNRLFWYVTFCLQLNLIFTAYFFMAVHNSLSSCVILPCVIGTKNVTTTAGREWRNLCYLHLNNYHVSHKIFFSKNKALNEFSQTLDLFGSDWIVFSGHKISGDYFSKRKNTYINKNTVARSHTRLYCL